MYILRRSSHYVKVCNVKITPLEVAALGRHSFITVAPPDVIEKMLQWPDKDFFRHCVGVRCACSLVPLLDNDIIFAKL